MTGGWVFIRICLLLLLALQAALEKGRDGASHVLCEVRVIVAEGGEGPHDRGHVLQPVEDVG